MKIVIVLFCLMFGVAFGEGVKKKLRPVNPVVLQSILSEERANCVVFESQKVVDKTEEWQKKHAECEKLLKSSNKVK
ncbi:MAG: hypothetical protein QM538_01210 [Methylacidiphilales bacterium]|nr:hypothetical protein [Candidatus Methylacidiphilales bacterium]